MKALLLIDFQNDFCPGGALAVPEGDEAAAVPTKLIPLFNTVILTQDWHPAGHHSFASSYEDKEPYSTTELSYGTQVLWPDHCVQGTKGAEFHPDLESTKADVIIRKGFRIGVDLFSEPFSDDHIGFCALQIRVKFCPFRTLNTVIRPEYLRSIG